MSDVVSELIVTLDGLARGTQSPGYFGYAGPDFNKWIETNTALPHRMLIGRKTYEMLSGLPKEVRDAGWERTTRTPGWLFSRTLKTVDWPGLQLVQDDLEGFVRKLKQDGGPEVRILGSLSLMRQLFAAKLLDRLKLTICPLVLPQTGIEPLYEGLADTGFELVSSQVLDGRVLLLEYRPAGSPPTGQAA